jgi:ribosomal protein S18 acetylase RimI-like enzyme
MGPIERNHEVVMVADQLPRTPNRVPPPYSIRPFVDTDVAAWTAIQAAADRYNEITSSLFQAVFGVARDVHAERILIACDGAGSAVGTAAAWMGDGDHVKVGRLHWVAVAPEHEGRALGRALVMQAITRLADLGHSTAYLTTSAARLRAIHLYDRCGFRPLIYTDIDRHVWEAIARRLAADARPLQHRVV